MVQVAPAPVLDAPCVTAQAMHAASHADAASNWRALFDPQTPCLVLPSPPKDVRAVTSSMDHSGDLSLRIMGDKPVLLQHIHKDLPAPLARYVAGLLDDYEAFMDADIMRVRLETVSSRACWKWHRDYTTLRLITTLRGAGTQYLTDPSQSDVISACETGEVGLFKGRLFGDYFSLKGQEACVHRSPPWNETDDPRLLLVIDMPQDFEIEDAAF